MPQRTQVWNLMFHVKYRAVYACECARVRNVRGNAYSATIAMLTSAQIAAWAIWKNVPVAWAVLVAIGQLLHIAKPYVPLIGFEKELLDSATRFDRLYLEYEKLWKEIQRGALTDRQAQDRLSKLQEKDLDIQERHTFYCPKSPKLMDQAHDETVRFLRLNFPDLGLEPRTNNQPEKRETI